MTELTDRFALPLLQPGQAQKELFHNEALALVDALLHPAVTAIGLASPPADPALGASWIVGAAPEGAWSGHADALAMWTDGGWRFVSPREGMTVWSIADGVSARWTESGWSIGVLAATGVAIAGEAVLGSRQPAIPDPVGGSAPDDEARAAIAAILAVLRAHGLIAI